MTFGTHKGLQKPQIIHVKLNGVELEQLYQYKYLGLMSAFVIIMLILSVLN